MATLPFYYNINTISTCYTERRKSKREGREVAVIAVLAYLRMCSEDRTKTRSLFINYRYFTFNYDSAYSIFMPSLLYLAKVFMSSFCLDLLHIQTVLKSMEPRSICFLVLFFTGNTGFKLQTFKGTNWQIKSG
jgi:hypothetical protein